MKSETKRVILITVGVVLGVPTTLCLIFLGLLWWGLCYGVDPMEAGIKKDGVAAMNASQRMGDQRTYVFIKNNNDFEVAVDLAVGGFNDRTTEHLHTVLSPRSSKRIYPGSHVHSLSVTKHNQQIAN